MKKADVTCPDYSACYRRIELTFKAGSAGTYRCLVCARVLEVVDGKTYVAYRLTVQPEKVFSEESWAAYIQLSKSMVTVLPP